MIRRLRVKYDEMPLTIKASIWYFFASFMQKGISTISTPIFTRIMTTQEYGEYQVFVAWSGIITIITTLCIYYDVCAQGLTKYSEGRDSFVSSLQGLNITLILAWTAFYLLFRKWINAYLGYNTVQMLCMYIMIWATAVYQFWAAEQRVKYNYRSLAILTISISIVKPIFEIILVLKLTDKVNARIIAVTMAELICYTGLFADQMRRGRVFYSRPDWKHAVFMGIPLIPHYMSQRILQSSDRIMIEHMVGAHETGIYSVAYSVAVLMTLITTAITQTITPWLYEKIKKQCYNEIARVVYSILIIVALANILLISFAPELVSIFAPSQYYEAIWVIPPVAMSVFFIFSYGVFSVFEFYYEKTAYVTIATAFGAVLNIVLNYIFIRQYGYYAAGYTTLFCYMMYTIAHYFFMRRVCKQFLHGEMVYDIRILLMIMSVFLIIGFLFLASYQNTVIRYLLICFSAILIVIKRKWLIESISNIIFMRKSRK